MKVLIVSFYYAPELGAAPSRITNMAEGLCSGGMEVEVLTCLPNYPKGRIFENYRHCFSKYERCGGIPVYRYWTYATVSKSPLARVWGMLSFSLVLWLFALHVRTIRSYDRIIVQTPPIMVACSAVLLFKKLFRKKLILNVSDLWPRSAVELGAVRKGSFYYKVLSWMERFIYRNADAVQGQSREILEHVWQHIPATPRFLYRNLQRTVPFRLSQDGRHVPFRIVYAGLLGVAQDVLSIVRAIDFKALGAELHLYGGGHQTEEIKKCISGKDSGVVYHGYLAKEAMREELSRYDASFVPLAVPIKGAVPSKIFDLMPTAVPVLLCGGGEAAEIVKTYGIGMVSAPCDYVALRANICRMKDLSDTEYLIFKQNCLEASRGDFSFDKQMRTYVRFVENLC